MTKIKICGITNLEDGLDAVKLGTDYIGFVFYEKSPRNVSYEKARDLSSRLEGVKKVGLFVNENPEKVRSIADLVGIDVLQFHGDETPEYCRQFKGREVWKAIRVKDEESIKAIQKYDSVDAIVLDAYVEGKRGGTGKTFDLELAVKAKKFGKRIVVAGGRNPSNVAEAIQKVNPYAVDVSSGVEESKRKKSYEKMKDFIETAKTPSVLLGIVKEKQAEVKALYSSGKAEMYKKMAKPRDSTRTSFYNAISSARTTPSPKLIAEFKITSPSNVRKGNPDFRTDANPEEIARIYEECGACAISVLTHADFKGELSHLQRIRKAVDLPLLRKEFIIDPAQIYETGVYGADAILLIGAILTASQIKEYVSIADSLGMDCLVESHNRRELEKAIEGGARIFGINNRNLHDPYFSTDINTTLELSPLIPVGRLMVTESGILTYSDVRKILDMDAMLVGETLMKSQDIKEKMYELQGI